MNVRSERQGKATRGMPVCLAGCIAVAVTLAPSWRAAVADQVWEIRGQLVEVEPGDASVAVLRLPDGRELRVPLDALTDGSRSAARRAGAAAADAETSGAPLASKPGTPTVPEAIRDVESDAANCRSAAEAVDVYRLFLAGAERPAATRAAAEARQREWAALAAKGLVRLGPGGRQVSPAEARAAAAEADNTIAHAIELLRLGNAKLAEEELRKASRIDPGGGRADFLAGLTYGLVARNHKEALDHFVKAARRHPDDPATLNNLAVAEILTRRYAAAPEHFRTALANAADPRPVGDNIAWAVKLAGTSEGDPRQRFPAKTVHDLNELYRTATQVFKLKPPDAIPAHSYLGPDGTPAVAATLGDVARVAASPWPAAAVTRCLGFVIAPGRVVCPRRAVVAADGTIAGTVTVELATNRGTRCTATVVAAPETADVALLECAGFAADPLPRAEAWQMEEPIEAVGDGGSWLGGDLVVARGRSMSADAPSSKRFVHSAVVPRGLGGGPIVDAAGRVIGMVAPTPQTDASGNTAGFGIPIQRIQAGLGEHLPEAKATAAAAGILAGTVIVSSVAGKLPPGAAPPPR